MKVAVPSSITFQPSSPRQEQSNPDGYSAQMARRSTPFELSSICGKHHVRLEQYLQRPSHKRGSTNKKDDFWIAVLEGVYNKEEVVVKVYGGPKEHLDEKAVSRAKREVKALRKLSNSSQSSERPAASPHAPHFRASFESNGHVWNDSSSRADCHVIVMTKVHGKHIGKEILKDPYKYRLIRDAFEKALKYGSSPHPGLTIMESEEADGRFFSFQCYPFPRRR